MLGPSRARHLNLVNAANDIAQLRERGPMTIRSNTGATIVVVAQRAQGHAAPPTMSHAQRTDSRCHCWHVVFWQRLPTGGEMTRSDSPTAAITPAVGTLIVALSLASAMVCGLREADPLRWARCV
jgi:hypothetical protein